MLEKFNKYLSNLSVWTMKLHNLHWNVEGEFFMIVHKLTEAEYDKAFERVDEIAEHCKMFGHLPASTLKEHLALASIKEESSRKFSCREALEIVLEDLKVLKNEATELRNACDKEGWFTAVSMFEDHVADYSKQIWFISATLAK